jgi:molybdopterin-containing oxidoreductase family iron-sulfur binding subunit
MGIKRRDFLRLAGLSTLIGLGGKTAFEWLAPGQVEASIKEAPLTAGTKWGMVVDMTKMDEHVMDECIQACHRTHNVPKIENPKHEIKWIWKEAYEYTFPGQHHAYAAEEYEHRDFLLLCNHCTNPPCCRVCPTKATWKREQDGIVMMDQHRCIGCRYCVVACPYGSRSFNWKDPRPHIPEIRRDYPTRTKGVVEKCNFCAERLAKGLLPACVEACNQAVGAGAMVFGDPEDPGSEVARLLRERFSIRRKPNLGTGPQVYYLV